MDSHELAWAAGFFDGEGNIRIKANRQHERPYLYPAIFIPQIDRQVLDRFQQAVAVGKVTGPHSRRRYGATRKDQWYFEAYGLERCQAIIALLWRWLSPVKHDQARAVLTAYAEARRAQPVKVLRPPRAPRPEGAREGLSERRLPAPGSYPRR
jgi:hypothetical protein